MEISKLLNFTVDIGAAMLVNGAEIRRVEETMERILTAYSAESPEIFATTNSIVVTVGEKGKPLTKSKRIYERDTNLAKLDSLNTLSRKICAEKPTADKIRNEFLKITNMKSYSIWLEVVAFGAIGFAYAIFFGGGFTDAVSAMIIAALVRIVQIPLRTHKINTFFMCILCSTLVAAASIVSGRFGFAENYDKAMTGALMTLVPGIALTNCMRDFIAEDFQSGLLGLVEALLTAVGIAIGVALAITLGRV